MTNELVIAPEHVAAAHTAEALIVQAIGLSKVATDEENESASVLESALRKRAGEVEEMRKIAKEPYLEFGRKVDAFFNPVLEKLKGQQKYVKGLMISYHDEQLRKAAEIQAKLDAETKKREEALQKQAIQEAKEKGETMVDLPVVDRVVVEVPKTVRTGFSSTTFREVWDFEVEDISKLPLKYLQANTAAIGQDVRGKDGVRVIPGVRIFSKKI